MAERLAESHEPVVDASDIFATQLAADCYRALGLLPTKASDKGTLSAAYMDVSALIDAKLGDGDVTFCKPLIIGTDDEYARQRSWKNTIDEHGRGRHQVHKEIRKPEMMEYQFQHFQKEPRASVTFTQRSRNRKEW